MAITVEPTVLGELLLEMEQAGQGESFPPRGAVPSGIYSTPLTEGLLDAGVRLLECLRSPVDCRVLGPQVVREIVFRVLQGERGGALRALAARNGSFSQIARALKRLHADYAQPWDVERMAREVGMSVSAFHHNFKAVTSASPLNYLKTLRLHKARMFMLQDGLNASTAASSVGYASPSQFSREFKRFFGSTPPGGGGEAARRAPAGRIRPTPFRQPRPIRSQVKVRFGPVAANGQERWPSLSAAGGKRAICAHCAKMTHTS